jgi:tetrahydromethanopterin S-methyltransferase subunit H
MKYKELIEANGLTLHGDIEHFAELVETAARADECEKSLRLWMLLDDVDTADDIAKADDAIYRSLCRQAHKKRLDVLTGDEIDAAIRARGTT